MANTNAPFGLRPVRNGDGSPWNQQVQMYYIPSTDSSAYAIGDVVKSAAGGDALTGAPAVQKAAAGDTLRGVVVGIGTSVSTPGGNLPGAFDPNNLAAMTIPATKAYAYYVWVADAPDTIFEAQVDSGTLTLTGAGSFFNKNANLTIASPTAPANQSASVVNSSSIATTSTLQLRLLGAPYRPDVDLTSGYAKVYVRINQHELAGNTAGV